MRSWITAAAVAVGVAAFSSGLTPWKDAITGAYDPPDIAQDVAAVRLFVERVNPYGPVIREMHSRVTGITFEQTYPYFPHPPFSLIVSLFMAFGAFTTAALLWFGLSLGLLFMLSALLAENLGPDSGGEPKPRVVLTLFGLLLLWPPVLYNLEKGQWSIILAVLVALGWRSLSQGRVRQGGSWIGVAAAVKVFPVLMGGYLLIRSRKAFLSFIIAGVIATALPLFWIGFGAFPDFMRQSQLNLPNWETFPSVMYSLHGTLARLMIGSQWAVAAVYAPALARGIEAICTLALLLVAGYLTVRAQRGISSPAVAFSAWCILLPVLNPQSMGHNGLLLALPVVLTGSVIDRYQGVWPKIFWTAGLVLASIPRQTLGRIAPPPVGPWEGLTVLALPMWGALLLFGVALTVSNASSATEKMRPNLVK